MGLDANEIDHEPESIRGGNGGWIRATYGDGHLHAYARFDLVGDRLELVEQYLRRPDGGPLRGPERATVQWGRLVAIANSVHIRHRIEFSLQFPSPDLARAAAYFSTSFGTGGADHWVKAMFHAQLDPSKQAPWPTEPGEKGRAPRPGGRLDARDAIEPRRRKPPSAMVTVPPGRPYGDHFYREVSTAYTALKDAGVAPNSAMAKANDVPKTTADRWVREARRRGFLGPAPRGNPISRW